MIINRTDAIANFQFENNTLNSVVGGTDGTVTGTEQYANSISGRAFDFNNSTIIEYGNSGLSNSSDLTIFMRLNADAYVTGERFFSKRTSGSGTGFFLQVSNDTADQLRLRVRNAANSAWVDAIITIADTVLSTIRVEINLSNNITVSYYDTSGVYTTSSTSFPDASYTSNAHNLTIGGFTGGGSEMDGKVDDFTVVTSILTDEDFYRYYMGLGITDKS